MSDIHGLVVTTITFRVVRRDLLLPKQPQAKTPFYVRPRKLTMSGKEQDAEVDSSNLQDADKIKLDTSCFTESFTDETVRRSVQQNK